MKLDDHTYVLGLPMDFGGISAPIHPTLIVDEAEGHTLVDTGLPDQEEAIAEAMAEAGVRVADLARIVLTHQDLDHVGSLRALARRSGARVAAHPAEAPHIDGRLRPIKPSPEELEGSPRMREVFERLAPTPVDEHVGDGDLLEPAGGVSVISTPGHTPGHVSLYLRRQKTLIAGDALTAEDGRLMGPPPPPMTLDAATAWRSVGRLAGLDVRRIVCYHGGVVDEDPGGQLRGLVREGGPPVST